MDPVSLIAGAVGQVASAIGNPLTVSQQRKLAEEQYTYGYASQVALDRAKAKERDTYLILAGVFLFAVLIIANRGK